MTDRPTTPDSDPRLPSEPADADALDRLALDALADDALGFDGEVAAATAAGDGRVAVVAAALDVRSPGRPLAGPQGAARVVDAHQEAAAATDAYVRSLTTADLTRTTWLGAPIGAVLAHLVGQLERVSALLDATLAGRPVPAVGDDYDHWHSTAADRQRFGGASPIALADGLTAVNTRIAAALATADGTDRLGALGDPASPATAALAKTFEMWMHTDDARLALGHDVTTPPPSTVLALCELATSLLPVGMATTGNARPGRTVRVVLTGAGGGTWRCPGSPDELPGTADDALLVADAVTFCRLFHKQVSPDVVPLAVDGDHELLDALLAGAQAFAERT